MAFPNRSRAWLRRGTVGVAIAAWLAVNRPWHWLMGDLLVYRAGGSALLHGRPLYSAVGGPEHLHFTYPPFAALFAAVLSLLPLAVAKATISGITAVALYLSLRLVAAAIGREGPPFGLQTVPLAFAVAIWLEPVRATFAFGQVNALLMVMVLADVLLPGERRSRGVLVGVAGAAKLTPLAFIPYFLVTGRRRAALVATATFVGCGLLGAALSPHASRLFWIDHRFASAQRVGRVENSSNQSIRGVLARLLHTTSVPGWWVAVAVAVLVVALMFAGALHRAGAESRAVVVMAIGMLCASPISWSHHWVWCAPMLLVCADLARTTRHRWVQVGAALVVVPFAAGLVFAAPHGNHVELHDSVVQQLVAASYVIAGGLFAVLVGADRLTMRGAAAVGMAHA